MGSIRIPNPNPNPNPNPKPYLYPYPNPNSNPNPNANPNPKIMPTSHYGCKKKLSTPNALAFDAFGSCEAWCRLPEYRSALCVMCCMIFIVGFFCRPIFL